MASPVADSMPQVQSPAQEQKKGFFGRISGGLRRNRKSVDSTSPATSSTPSREQTADNVTETSNTPLMEPVPTTPDVAYMLKNGEALARLGANLQDSASEADSNPPPKDLIRQMDAAASKPTAVSGAIEKVQVYYVHVKDGVMEIVGSINGKIVFIKAKVCEVVGMPGEKLRLAATSAHATATAYLEQARSTLNAKALYVQDGYIYVTATVEGRVVHIKAVAMETYDTAKAQVLQTVHVVDKYTAPVRSNALALVDSSKSLAISGVSLAISAAQPFKPYYMKVHNGVVYIVAPIGDAFVVMQARIAEIFTSIHVRVVESLTAAQGVIVSYTRPVVDRAIALRTGVEDRVCGFCVSIKDGVVRVRGAVGKRVLDVSAKLSDVVNAVHMQVFGGIKATRQAIADLTAKLVSIVSEAYGKAYDSVSLLCCRTKDGFLYMACKVNEKTLVFRIKVAELVEFIQLKSRHIYGATLVALTDTYSVTKTKVLQVTDTTRNFVNDPKAQVTVVSAAGGAVTLGAGGGAAGFLTGGALGAIVAIPAAFFTFGLSIPAGAAMGASTGLFVGTATGSAAGLVTGGVAGYNAHNHKDGIGHVVNSGLSKVKAVKDSAVASTSKLGSRVAQAARLGHTGGSAAFA